MQQECRDTKADASAEMQRLAADWSRRMDDLRARVREATVAAESEKEVAVLRARKEAEDATRREVEQRTEGQVNDDAATSTARS